MTPHTDTDRATHYVALAALYPVVSDQMRCSLRRRGAPPWVVDDVIAEAFARALAKPPSCPHEAFGAWLHVVARNVYADWWRHERRYVWSDAIPEERHVEDVADTVTRRETFQRACYVVTALPANQRDALLDLLVEDCPPDSADRADLVRRASTRYRARATLARRLAEIDVSY